jgi:hypothetical protein
MPTKAQVLMYRTCNWKVQWTRSPGDLGEQFATPQPNRHEVSNSEQNPGSRYQIIPSGGQEEPSAGDSLTPSRPSSADWGVAAFASCGLRIETFASVPRANRCRTHEIPRHVRAITRPELEVSRLLWSSCSSAYQPTTSTPSTLKYFRCVPRTKCDGKSGQTGTIHVILFV